MSHRTTAARCTAGLFALLIAGTAVAQDQLAPLRVCADPANMPLSNKKGEGFQNKVAEVLAREMGTTLEYFWYPYYGRGLVRSTINAERCDVLMDVPADFEMALTTTPVFKSTFVLAYRTDRKYTIASLDDDLLKTINIGVFQSSPAREALRMHGVMENTTVQYILFDAAAAPEDQPAKQIENVIDGKIDAAESWGPIAGYYAKQKQAPITLLPMNRMSDGIPLEFAVSLGVRRSDKELQQKLNTALVSGKDRIRAVLDAYGVPLVSCTECVISGDLPAHGPYPDRTAEIAEINRDKPVSSAEALAAVKKNVAAGADPTQALAEAVIGNDPDRVRWLLANKADPNKTVDADYNALQWAVREGRLAVAQVLLESGADPNKADATNWSPVMFAVWRDNPAMVKLLASKGAKLDAFGAQGWNALSVAIAYAGLDQVKQLVELGANVNAANPVGYTPLMFATAKGADGVPEYLIEKGARVGAANQAGITSLMMAAAENNAALTRLLLKAGADPAARDGQHRTAFDIATLQGHKDITALLSKPR